jgi:Rrf2 family protein
MIRSVRGFNGGFHLARSPKEITLLEVLEVMDGPLAIVGCVDKPEKCPRSGTCGVQGIWSGLNAQIRNLMRGITLEDILAACRRADASAGILDYCI